MPNSSTLFQQALFSKSCCCLALEEKVQQVTLELGETAEISGRKPANKDVARNTQEEKVFSPWDLDESMEIETGLQIVKRKEGGRSGS